MIWVCTHLDGVSTPRHFRNDDYVWEETKTPSTHTHTHTHTLCTTQFFISFHFWGDLLPSPSSPCMSYDGCTLQHARFSKLVLSACMSYDGCTLQHARFSKLVFLWLSQRVNKSLLLLAWACSSASKAHFMNVLTIPFVHTNPCYISLLLDDMFSGFKIWFLDTPKKWPSGQVNDKVVALSSKLNKQPWIHHSTFIILAVIWIIFWIIFGFSYYSWIFFNNCWIFLFF
jgi:hypothetical protein